MDIEYEEFSDVTEVFLYMASAAAPLKNTVPMSSYKGYLMSFIPLSAHGADKFLMIYAKGALENGIYEFDVSTKSYRIVEGIERADRVYFVVLTPTRNTIADKALKNI